MPQVKKREMRQAILDGSYLLFRKQGYYQTTLRQIAREAGTSLANVYVYFASKYEIVFEIYDPWMTAKITQLEREAARIKHPDDRLRHILFTLWGDIPSANNGFARNIMQALSMARGAKQYNPQMIKWMEDKLTALVVSCLPAQRRKLAGDGSIAHVLMMAFDGFVINYDLNPSAACSQLIVDAIGTALLGRKLRAPRRARQRLAGRAARSKALAA
jgi:AcrR family transcriptional regulator